MATVANHETDCLPSVGELSVKVDCLPFSQIPHTTKLFLDFLSYSPKIRGFYPASPVFPDWLKEIRAYDSARRQRVSDVLERQNRSWTASPKSLANIERLRAGASAVVTGQQVGLFGGPFFSLLKALTAVKLAEEATAAGVDAVPIFWLATNDHDLAEVNHTAILSPEGLRKIATPSHGINDDAPVGTVTFGTEIEDAVKTAIDALGPVPAMDLLRESYRPGENLGSAFARLFARLFSEFGVILMDPSDADLYAIAQPIYKAAIERVREIDDALLARGKELESAGYHQQVKVTPSSTLLFMVKDGARIPIHRRTNGNGTPEFLIGEEKLSQDQLLKHIAEKPDDFSPNVLLRPIVQDHLLPTLAYTGGSAEVAYFAQVGVVYEKLLGRVTPIVPRLSATIVEKKTKSLLERYRLDLTDAFHGEDALREKAAASTFPEELQAAFDQAAQSLDQSLGMVKHALGRLDKTLVEAADNAASKMQHQLESLRARAARAEARQSEIIGRHAQQLSNSLFPNKTLQEREIGAIYFLARYGVEFLQTLHDTLQTSCHDHQVVSFD